MLQAAEPQSYVCCICLSLCCQSCLSPIPLPRFPTSTACLQSLHAAPHPHPPYLAHPVHLFFPSFEALDQSCTARFSLLSAPAIVTAPDTFPPRPNDGSPKDSAHDSSSLPSPSSDSHHPDPRPARHLLPMHFIPGLSRFNSRLLRPSASEYRFHIRAAGMQQRKRLSSHPPLRTNARGRLPPACTPLCSSHR